MTMISNKNAIEEQNNTFDLENLIERKDLESIISNFSAATGLASGIVKMRSEYEDIINLDTNELENRFKDLDPERDRLTCIAGNSNFCDLIRKSRTGDLRCWWSDMKYCSEAFRNNHPVLYRCHAGLIDIVAPIRLGSWHVANIYIGQIQSDLTEADLHKYFSEFITRFQPLDNYLKSDISEKEFNEIITELDLQHSDPSLTFQKFKSLIAELPSKKKENIHEIDIAIKLLKLMADLISSHATSQAIMQIMKDIDRKTGISLDIDSGLSVFLKNAKRIIQYNFSGIWLVDRQEQVLNLVTFDVGDNTEFSHNKNTLKIRTASIGKVAQYKKLILYETAAKIETNLPHPNFLLNIPNQKSWGSVPLLAGDRLIGLWIIGSDKEYAFDTKLLTLLETLASHAALFVKSVRDRINMVHIMSQYEKDDLLESVVEKIPEMVCGKGCSIFLKKDQGERAFLVASRGLPKALIGKAHYDPGEGLTGWVLKHGQLLNVKIHEDITNREKTVKSISTDLNWKSKYREFESDMNDLAKRPFLAAPLKTKDGKILGVIRVSMRTEQGNFTLEDEALLVACSDQLVSALERPLIASDLKHRIKELRLLSDISAELTQMVDLITLLNRIADKAAKVLQCGGITIWLLNEKKDKVELTAGFGPHSKYIGEHFYKLGEGLTGTVAKTGEPIWVKSAHGLPGWKGKYNNLFSKEYRGFTPLIILPLQVKNEIIGVIKFTREPQIQTSDIKIQKFDADEYNLAWILSRQISFVIKNTKILDDLKNQIIQLQAAQEKIVLEREEAWKEFSAITAHRMGSDVADISGALYWLKQSISNNDEREKIVDYLKRMDDTLLRIKKNVFDFIEFAKPPRLSFESIHINQLLKDINDKTSLDNVESIFNLQADLPMISADRESLTYAFRELFQNADKAVVSDGKLTIETRLSDSPNEIIIHISDNGKGIPQELKQKIFEIGFRNQSGGTGLGLAIAKRYIEQHNGTIEEIGEECKGAHFIIRLPINQDKNMVQK